ncbi:MAG TPA: hypothetical protein VK563_00270 [Puia sp.]|nr:hypothetical protein [Puia sp.]
MNNFLRYGRLFFALGIIALGVVCLIVGDFIVGRPPEWPAQVAGKLAWAYIAGTLFIILGLAIILRKMAGAAALTIGAIILIYSFLFRYLPNMIGQSFEAILWTLNGYKTLALAGGAFIVAASFFGENNRGISFRQPGSPLAANKGLVMTGIIFLSLFLIMCGCSHFKYAEFVFGLIPAYIPFHVFWTYFTAVALLAAGIGLLLPRTRKLAAALSGVMVFAWFILLHIPRFVTTPNDPSDRMGLFESLAISGILLVLAGITPSNPHIDPAKHN